MHSENLSAWTHQHSFDSGNPSGERGARLVMWITAAMMVIEIAAGLTFNSMALLADGWHMSSHALAIGLSAFAYAAARRLSKDTRFAFGTWKIEVLGGFASAILLLVIALLMVIGSVERLLTPQPIQYVEAMVVGVVGLLVNLVCALILGKAHDHHDDHVHNHGHEHGHHHDLNLKSAYVHVIADAATSVLAIIALAGGWMFGWSWLDPVMGIAGSVLVVLWAKRLLIDTGKVLLDREMDHPVVEEIREALETGPEAGETRVVDLHVWRVGRKAYACAISLITHDGMLTPQHVRGLLAIHEEIAHATVEIQRCPAAAGRDI